MELTTEQRDLRDAVRGLLARHRKAGAVEPGAAGGPGAAGRSSAGSEPRAAAEPRAAGVLSAADEPGAAAEPRAADQPSAAGEPNAGSDPNAAAEPRAAGVLSAAGEPNAGSNPNAGSDPNAAGEPSAGDGPGYDGPLWQRLCGEIGIAGLAIPERYGGAGAGLVETCLVLKELGRGLVPSPLLGSAVLAGQALLASGDEEACQRLLPGIAGGGTVAALAWAAQAGHWDPAEAAFTVRRGTGAAAGGWALTGTAHHVLDGDTAGVLLAAARAPDGIGLFEVDPRHSGVARHPVTTMDTTRRLAAVALDGVPGRRLGAGPGGPALARARDLACIALAAEQAGAAQRALELTVAYAKTRVQFGRPIGSFQALQHRMADLHVLVESAWSLCYAAAFAAGTGAGPDADPAGLGMLAAAAKAHCSHALTRAAGQMIQLHGAIGITWEHDAHRYFKRAHGTGQLFGRPEEHVARIAAALIDGRRL